MPHPGSIALEFVTAVGPAGRPDDEAAHGNRRPSKVALARDRKIRCGVRQVREGAIVSAPSRGGLHPMTAESGFQHAHRGQDVP